jgi:hypothetical protein
MKNTLTCSRNPAHPDSAGALSGPVKHFPLPNVGFFRNLPIPAQG